MDIPFKVVLSGLYFPKGDFFVDAAAPVSTCIITHAHADHARLGHKLYIATYETIKVLQHRFGRDFPHKIVDYGEKFKMGSLWVSLHPAGHILGSSQVRVEDNAIVSVISGDYKRNLDLTCAAFEVVECDIFVSESTFALPIYKWNSSDFVRSQIFSWWEENASQNRPSVLFCYSLGKAQRIMSLFNEINRNIYCHGAIFSIAEIYKQLNVKLPPFEKVLTDKTYKFSKELIIAPPSAFGTPWMKRFVNCHTAFASGWMEVRGNKRRRAVDRGFVISDHADFEDLVQTIVETKAKKVFTTHGNAGTLAKYLREEKNIEAQLLSGLDLPAESED